MKFLHSSGYDIFNVRDDDNKDAFERALEYCSFETTEFLVRMNPKIAKVNEIKKKELTDSVGLINTLKKVKRE